MNIDHFSEQIRRKLESIRPDFNEDDWLRMQNTLRRAGVSTPPPPKPTPPLGGATGLIAVGATIATVVLSVYTLRQQHELDRLRQTITQQNPPAVVQPATPAQPGNPAEQPNATRSLRTRASAGPQPAQTAQTERQLDASSPDVPATTDAPAGPGRTAVDRPVGSPVAQSGRQNEPIRDERIAMPSGNRRSEPRPGEPMPETNPPAAPITEPGRSTAATRSQPRGSLEMLRPDRNRFNLNRPNRNGEPADRPERVATTTSDQGRRAPVERNAGQLARAQPNAPTGSLPNAATPSNQTTNPAPDRAGRPERLKITDNGNGVTATQPPAEAVATAAPVVNSLPNRPLSVTSGSNWTDRIAQIIKPGPPIASVPTAPVNTPAKPVVRPVEAADAASRPVPKLNVRLRLGVGGEVSPRLLSGGLAGEVLLGRHWAISAGLSRTRLTGDTYQTDDDYNDQHRPKPGPSPYPDFHRDYAPNLDPKHQIFNINFAERRWQLPLGLTYRLPLSPALTLLPTVGTTLNLSSREWVSFSYSLPHVYPRSDDEKNVLLSRGTPPLITSWYVSTGLEWQRSHWVMQGMPMLILPTQRTPTAPGRADPTNVQFGGRLRLFYQF